MEGSTDCLMAVIESMNTWISSTSLMSISDARAKKAPAIANVSVSSEMARPLACQSSEIQESLCQTFQAATAWYPVERSGAHGCALPLRWQAHYSQGCQNHPPLHCLQGQHPFGSFTKDRSQLLTCGYLYNLFRHLGLSDWVQDEDVHQSLGQCWPGDLLFQEGVHED